MSRLLTPLDASESVMQPRTKYVLQIMETVKLSPFYCLQCVMSTPNSCVVVRVNVLASGQVYVMSTQNSCVVVYVNDLASGQVEVSRDANLDCFSWPSFILCILPFGH